jgi:hypothetical protein
MLIFFDTVFFTHGEIGEFVGSTEVVRLKAFVAIFFGPDTTYSRSLNSLS